EERRQPVPEIDDLLVAGIRLDRLIGLVERPLEDRDDRIALAQLALGDHPAEPLPVIPHRAVGRARGPATAHPARLRDALDQAPRLRLREREARRTMREPERLTDLALGERRLS